MCHFLAPAGQSEMTRKIFMHQHLRIFMVRCLCMKLYALRRDNAGKEEPHLNRKYISAVSPLENYILQVDFVSGSRLLLDMKPYLDKLRFRPLSDPQLWSSAVTNGIFIRFGNIELSHDELFAMAEQAH